MSRSVADNARLVPKLLLVELSMVVSLQHARYQARGSQGGGCFHSDQDDLSYDTAFSLAINLRHSRRRLGSAEIPKGIV